MIKDSKRAKELSILGMKSPNVGKHGKRKSTLILEKVIEKKAESIVEDMMELRHAVVKQMHKTVSKTNFVGASIGLKNLNHDVQLLSGKDTSRLGINLDDAEKEEIDNIFKKNKK